MEILQDYAFISRHKPTPEQIKLAQQKAVRLVPIGDTDAFTVTPEWVKQHGHFIGVVVVHPAAAMNLMSWYDIGVFRNENRAPVGQKPEFRASAFHIWYWDSEQEFWDME